MIVITDSSIPVLVFPTRIIIKTTQRFYLTPEKIGIIKIASTGQDVRKKNSATLLVGIQTSTTTMESSGMENSVDVPEKLKIKKRFHLTYLPCFKVTSKRD